MKKNLRNCLSNEINDWQLLTTEVAPFDCQYFKLSGDFYKILFDLLDVKVASVNISIEIYPKVNEC